MTTITIHVSRETEKRLRAKAARSGQSLESYLQHLALKDAQEANGAADEIAQAELTLAELDRCLDELTTGLPELPRLPADLSRSDIYGEHN